MNRPAPVRLFIEPFLRELQHELGYPMDMGKMKLFVAWASSHDWANEPEKLHRLYATCKLLFLQEVEHEGRFSQAFLRYVHEELAWRHEVEPAAKTAVKKKASKKAVKKDEPTASPANPVSTLQPTPKPVPPLPETLPEPEPPDDEPPRQSLGEKKFLNLHLRPALPQVAEEIASRTGAVSSRFLFTDDYLPLSYREMAQCWRYLRQKDEFRPGRQLNVEETVLHFAKEGMLLAPVFQQEALNSEDLLLILADRRGSMTPFHRLTDRLVEAARKEGGHRRAQVLYFYNCPSGFLFRQPNLTVPVPLAQVWNSIRHDRTNALVISDGGAARGNFNQNRLDKTLEFLNDEQNGGANGLHKRAHFVAWLNPLPRHRWAGTTAEAIEKDGRTPMFPLLEAGKAGLLQAVHSLTGKG